MKRYIRILGWIRFDSIIVMFGLLDNCVLGWA